MPSFASLMSSAILPGSHCSTQLELTSGRHIEISKRVAMPQSFMVFNGYGVNNYGLLDIQGL